jgi:DNA-binding beta-propeller fold protein YncE
MKKGILIALLGCMSTAFAQQAPAPDPATLPFAAGQPLKMTPNAKTYGGFRFAESISYDPDRDLYVVPSAGIAQDVIPNDGYVSLVNPDGTTHTLKWIGVNRNGLTLNHPLGSDIANGMLYLADIDTVRWFDMKTGEPRGSVQVPGVSRFNDIEVAADGTIYGTQTGDTNSDTWRVYKITPQGQSSVFFSGAPLERPNGIAFDPKGNIVVVNIGTNDVLTFSPAGKLLTTEKAVDPGNDGLAILPDGTKYVSSVRLGTISRIRPGQPAEIVASGIPTAASMTYDSRRNRLVIPMNDWNAITIVDLNMALPKP